MNDVRFALRQLLKNPGFTVVAVVTLALGIGANLAVVSLVNSLFFRPLPGLSRPERLVVIGSTYRNEGFGTTSYPDFRDLRDANSVFLELSAFAETPLSFSADNATERLLGEMVSDNYFRTLGVRMAAGRDFLPEDDSGRNPVVIISDSLWQRRWNRDTAVLGRTLTLNGTPFVVVGVAGARFRGCQLPNAHDLWVPLHLRAQLQSSVPDRLDDRGFTFLRLVGCLKEGGALAQASSNLALLARQLEAAYPGEDKDRAYRALAYSPFPAVGKTAPRIFMGVLFGISLIMVTVVCANVASLFLARLLSRRRDVAVRLALGASRLRLVRQTLIEAVLVSVIGVVIGLLLASQGSHLLLSQIPGDRGEPVSLELSLDGRIAWFSVGLILASTLLTGLLPAVQTTATSVLPTLKSSDAFLTTRRSRLRFALVMLQVALALPLLSGAGLLFRSLNLLGGIDLGMRADNLLLADLDLSLNGYNEPRAQRFYNQLREGVSRLPGVEAASLAALPPLRTGGVGPGSVYGGRFQATEPLNSGANFVSPDYFRTTGITLLRGREFLSSDREDSQPVAIINETLARKLWPDQDALGQLIYLGNSSAKTVVGTNESPKLVIGIARDAIYSDLIEDARKIRPFYYLPLSQRSVLAQSLHVRTSGNPTALLSTVRAVLDSLDPTLPLFHVTTLKTVRDRSMFAQRIAVEVVSFSGVLAIFLAMLGLYAAMRNEALSRTREIGIRLAVGARRGEIVSMIVRQGMKLAGLGILGGLGASLALTRVIRNLLFGVSATDPLTFVLLLLLAISITLAACWLPARRAAKIDPMEALRYE